MIIPYRWLREKKYYLLLNNWMVLICKTKFDSLHSRMPRARCDWNWPRDSINEAFFMSLMSTIYIFVWPFFWKKKWIPFNQIWLILAMWFLRGTFFNGVNAHIILLFWYYLACKKNLGNWIPYTQELYMPDLIEIRTVDFAQKIF